MRSTYKNKILISVLAVLIMVFAYQDLSPARILVMPTKAKISGKTIKGSKKSRPKLHTIESGLSPQTKELIKKIKKHNDKSAVFNNYNAKTYREFTRYLNSEWYVKYENGIHITDMLKIKKRIKTVEKVNAILYKKVKKIYKGKNIKTLESYEEFIEEKISYKISNPDMYRNMKKGSCVSYATMLKAMCDMSGIPCRIYAGWATPWDGHCWNRVKVKGRWFWCDLCWDDNTIYGDTSYLHQRRLWEDHFDYKPLTIYRPSLPY